MKYLIGMLLIIISMTSHGEDDWYIGTWIIDAEKSKEHSAILVGKEQRMAKAIQKNAENGIYEIKEEYFKLYSVKMAVSSPKFEYFTEETDDNTLIIESVKSSKEKLEIGRNAYGVYLVFSKIKYKKKDAMNYVYDDNGNLVIEEEHSVKAYLKEYDKEIDLEHFEKFVKEKRYK